MVVRLLWYRDNPWKTRNTSSSKRVHGVPNLEVVGVPCHVTSAQWMGQATPRRHVPRAPTTSEKMVGVGLGGLTTF